MSVVAKFPWVDALRQQDSQCNVDPGSSRASQGVSGHLWASRFISGHLRAWGGFCEELVEFLRSHYLRILRASALHLRSIICAFLPPTPNAPDAEGDPCRSWLSPGCCISIRISDAHYYCAFTECAENAYVNARWRGGWLASWSCILSGH